MNNNLDEIRHKLEEVAADFTEDNHTWDWDPTKMHLTIRYPDGSPLATLHVEQAN